MEKKKFEFKAEYVLYLIIVGCIIVGISFINYDYGKPYEKVDNLYDLPEPIQKSATGKTTVKHVDVTGKLTYVAKYSISGRVVDKQNYKGVKALNNLSPVDFSIVWGKWAADKYINKVKMISNGNRFVTINSLDNSWWNSNGGLGEFEIHFSNNHIIPANDEIRKKVLSVRNHEFIKLDGYLVNVVAEKKNEYYTWETSTSRYDKLDGACEIILVNNITWLK